MGLLFGSHQNLGLVKPVNMTTVIKTIRRGNTGSRMEISITTDGVEKSVKEIKRNRLHYKGEQGKSSITVSRQLRDLRDNPWSIVPHAADSSSDVVH